MASALLNHRIDGSGRPVVLLHPVGLDLTFLEPLAVKLSQQYTAIRVDLRGHGGSPTTPPAVALADYADDIHGLLMRLGCAPAAVVGFSFGGMLAQVVALNYPADVSALVISACPSTLSQEGRAAVAGRGAQAERHGMAAVVDSTMERWFTDSFRQRGGDAPARTRLLSDDVEGWAQAWRAMARIHTAPHLASIRVPTLCLAGEVDLSSPPQVVEAIAKGIPGARFATIPGAPHMLFIEQPDAVASAITDFLAALSERV
jgi:3-oxoadipate enol-lactonase